jgi:hypothetical protein
VRWHTVGVKRPYAEEIIGEWGIRDVTPPSQVERELLEADRDLNPLVGSPLRRRIRNFRAEPDNYLASLGGPLPYMTRLREIDALTAQHEQQLAETYEALAGDVSAWSALVHGWDFGEVNELIDRHNRWYPAERRLPMDPKTGDYALVNGRSYRRRPLDATWVLERFPLRAA